MAKKAAKKFVLSRAKLEKKLEELAERVVELDMSETTPNDLDQFLADLSNDLSDLAYEVTAEAE